MKTANFTMKDLLEEIKAQSPEFAQGETKRTVEMAEALGVGETTMRRKLRKLLKDGKIRPVAVTMQAINGRVTTTTGWVAVPEVKEEK